MKTNIRGFKHRPVNISRINIRCSCLEMEGSDSILTWNPVCMLWIRQTRRSECWLVEKWGLSVPTSNWPEWIHLNSLFLYKKISETKQRKAKQSITSLGRKTHILQNKKNLIYKVWSLHVRKYLHFYRLILLYQNEIFKMLNYKEFNLSNFIFCTSLSINIPTQDLHA